MSDDHNIDRRKFLKQGIAAGTCAIALSGDALASVNSKKVKVLTTDGKLIEVDENTLNQNSDKDSNSKIREGLPGKKFVMVIDLARCKNARQCVSACNKMHAISGPNEWLKVYKMQDSENTAPYWQPVVCQHCDSPACVKVCPVDATFKRKDGIVLIDNERCIGCRFCMAACPYSARVFNWSEPTEVVSEEHHKHHNPATSLPQQKGTVGKCDFCPDMLEQNQLPHCVSACPNSVFFFGNMYEDSVTNGSETFVLSELLEKRAGYRMMEDLGLNPNVYYLPPSDRLYDFDEGLENYEKFKEEPNSIENEN